MVEPVKVLIVVDVGWEDLVEVDLADRRVGYAKFKGEKVESVDFKMIQIKRDLVFSWRFLTVINELIPNTY